MEKLIIVAYILFMIIFLITIFITWKFQFGSEGKDERGQKIMNTAYSVAFPIFPIGWLLIKLYHDYVVPLEYDLYKWLIWILMVSAFIIHGIAIFVQKRRL